MTPKYTDGDHVRFMGNPDGDDHADYAQLIGYNGVVVDADEHRRFIDVQFENHYWTDEQTGKKSNVFPVLRTEVEAVK